MKLLIASTLICLSLITSLAFTAPPFDTCACSADDSSCNSYVNCPGGCLSFCPNNGGCRAMCVKDDDGGDGGPRMIMMSSVSLRFNGSNSRTVSAELSRISGQEVVFTPSVPDDTVTLDVNNLPFWDVLEILSKSGRIQLGYDDFSNLRAVRRALLYGDRISVCMHGVSIKRLARELRYLTGLDIKVTSGDEKAVVNFTAKGVTFNDIVAQVSEQTGAQLAVK